MRIRSYSNLLNLHSLAFIVICLAGTSHASTILGSSTISRTLVEKRNAGPAKTANSETVESFQWNIDDKELPLLALESDRLKSGFDQALTFPMSQFRLLVFQSLNRDEEHGRYLLSVISSDSKVVHLIEFESIGDGKKYVSLDGLGMELIDQNNLKVIRTSDGVKLVFNQYPDGEFRCASIENSTGAHLHFLYAAKGFTLQGFLDSFGRTIRFNYGGAGIASVTQTWMAKSTGFTKTWPIGEASESGAVESAKHPSAFNSKVLPRNALTREYTAEMVALDKTLATIFGGSGAVAAANGFEPAGLAGYYPLYRGDMTGDDGRPRRGHLSCAMHIYGNAEGTGDSGLYVPAGFTSHSGVPSPTDAAVTFYYPRLGNSTDITLAVFHVADFQITYEDHRVRIGNLGGPGGSSLIYRHSHIEFYKGNIALPSAAARTGLQVNPSSLFSQSENLKACRIDRRVASVR